MHHSFSFSCLFSLDEMITIVFFGVDKIWQKQIITLIQTLLNGTGDGDRLLIMIMKVAKLLLLLLLMF